MQGLRELWREEKTESRNKGEPGGQEVRSTVLSSLDLWDRRMSGCRVCRCLEHPSDILLRVPSKGLEGRLSIETMLILQAGESLKDFFALYLCVDNVNLKILSLIVESIPALGWPSMSQNLLFFFFLYCFQV